MREFIKIKETKKGGNKCLLVDISQYLTIDDVTELRKNVLKHIQSCNSLSIEMKMMENIDVSGLQLLIAIKRKTDEMGIDYTCNFEASDELKSLLSRSGFEKLLTEIHNNKLN